jgi:hypothetical protein
MNDPYVVAVQGIKALDELTGLSGKVEMSAVQAINKTIASARTASARAIRTQVNLPASYLNRQDRLGITKKATRGDLEAVITGRHRATSLAQFATNGRKGRGVIPRVQIEPSGSAVKLSRAFFVNLRSGNTDTKGNLGIAIRLPDGKRPDRAYKPTQLGKNLWLLYGPAISQVFDDVATDLSPGVADQLEAEFLRLMDLK